MAPRSKITKALLFGVLVSSLSYYVISSVPPGVSLGLSSEPTATEWSNVSFEEDTSNSAEIMYVLRVNHSPTKGVIAMVIGGLVTIIILRKVK